MVFGCCGGGGALMTRVRDFFRGPEISFSPCNTTKKSGPGLKMLRKGTLRLLNKNPLENLAISGWLLKMQGGVAVCLCSILRSPLVQSRGCRVEVCPEWPGHQEGE
jgi:hypothetical protein